MPPSNPTSSSELQPYLTRIEKALSKISTTGNGYEDLHRAVDGAVREAAALSAEGPPSWDTPFTASFRDTIGSNLRALRVEAEWTQVQLAESMTTLGFDWKRITVAEVEAATRGVSFEEVLGLAVLFAVPMVELLVPDGTRLEFPPIDLSAETVRELIIGSDGKMGEGGITWRAAARAAGKQRRKSEWRPAADLWTRRAARNPAPKAGS